MRRRDQHRGTPADLVVIGLGNPGEEYAHTRHNAGSWVVHELVRRHGGRLRRGRRDHTESDVLTVGGARLVVAVPTSYYNEIGRGAHELTTRHGITDLARLLIIHDELDLPVGRMKLKVGGGLAGNNGLKSARAHLHSADFARLRIGIGKPESDTMRGRDYVLRRPARSERPVLEQVVAEAADAVEYLAVTDIEAAMNRFNAN